jgi:hypothetical protein
MTPKAASSSAERQLLEKAGEVRLWAVSPGRRVFYEVSSPNGTWTYNLLFPALGRFDRLARKRAA